LYRGVRKPPQEKVKLPKRYGNATELPGTVAVGNGSFIAVTTHDLSTLVMSGDRIQIADQQCVVEDCRSAMLTLKCNTISGAWMSWYTGVNYNIFLLPPRHYPMDTCLQDLRALSFEKMKCLNLKCIARLQAMECAVHADCEDKVHSSFKSVSRNLNCIGYAKGATKTLVVPRATMDEGGKDKWGFFTRL